MERGAYRVPGIACRVSRIVFLVSHGVVSLLRSCLLRLACLDSSPHPHPHLNAAFSSLSFSSLPTPGLRIVLSIISKTFCPAPLLFNRLV